MKFIILWYIDHMLIWNSSQLSLLTSLLLAPKMVPAKKLKGGDLTEVMSIEFIVVGGALTKCVSRVDSSDYHDHDYAVARWCRIDS